MPPWHWQTSEANLNKFVKLFEENNGPNASNGRDIFSNEQKLTYSPEAIKKVEENLKDTLTSLVQFIFGSCNVQQKN